MRSRASAGHLVRRQPIRTSTRHRRPCGPGPQPVRSDTCYLCTQSARRPLHVSPTVRTPPWPPNGLGRGCQPSHRADARARTPIGRSDGEHNRPLPEQLLVRHPEGQPVSRMTPDQGLDRSGAVGDHDGKLLVRYRENATEGLVRQPVVAALVMAGITVIGPTSSPPHRYGPSKAAGGLALAALTVVAGTSATTSPVVLMVALFLLCLGQALVAASQPLPPRPRIPHAATVRTEN